MSDTKITEERIPTNLRTLLIMEALAASKEPLSPTEINRSLGLPKQSIHRLCQMLVDEGFLIKDESGKQLKPAERMVKIADGLFDASGQEFARHQILVGLSEATGETVNYSVPALDGMTYVDRVETAWAFRIELPVGTRVPFYCTAGGKCFLASLPPKKLDQLLEVMNFEQRTPNTITEPDILREEVEQVRDRGFSIDDEELYEGMIALSVPVLDYRNQYQASIAFHGPTQRLDRRALIAHFETMRKGAAQLAALTT